MFGRLHRLVCFQDVAIRPNQVADTFRLPGFRILRGTMGNGHKEIFIAEQIKRKGVFFVEFLILCVCIIADPKNRSIPVIQFLDSITEPFTFTRSSWCTGSWIEPEDNVLTCIIRQ